MSSGMHIFGLGALVDIVKLAWSVIANRPRLRLEVVDCSPFRWTPRGKGLSIWVEVEILLTNSGPVETTVKDAFIEVYQSIETYRRGKIQCRLDELRFDTMEVRAGLLELRGSSIGPRKMWGPKRVVFKGFWEVDTLPETWYARLIVEPIGQGRLEERFKLTREMKES